MKKLLSLTLSVLLLLSAIACSREEDAEPPLQTTVEGEEYTPSPFADTNTSKRCYFADSGAVYKDDYYQLSSHGAIVAIPLSEAVKHNVLEEGIATPVSKYKQLCFDPLCNHNDYDCPTKLYLGSEFLIDATESNGELPVIYYHRSVYGNEIVRFDVAAGEAKQVISSDDPVKQLMAYGDYLYYTTMTSKDEMVVQTVKKTGEDAHHLATGAAAIELIGANEQGAYFNDDKGNVYALDLDGESYEKIYTLGEYYVLGHPGRGAAELNMMVYGDYLYYFADYNAVELPYGNRTEKFNDHSIRRVKLDALDVPSAEGEMVAESVYDTAVYGIYNGVLYYGPFDVRTNLEENPGSEWCHSNGTINGVDLETLETFVVISDCGFNLMGNSYYVSDRCIIGSVTPYRDVNGSSNDSYSYAMLLDFKTGAVYCVEGQS